MNNVYVLKYAMDLLKEKKITARQAILLGIVDKFCSPFSSDYEPEPDRCFRVDYLRSLLHVSHANLTASIEGLAALRPKVFRAKRLDRHWWCLKTKSRNRNHDPAELRIPNSVLAMMGGPRCEAHVTPMEALVLAHVASFSERGQLCYLTNKHIAGNLGVKPVRVKRLVNDLWRKGLVESHLMTHEDLRRLLVKQYGTVNGFKRSGGRTSRVLVPTMDELHPACDATPDHEQ